jgi:geranylgeranyl pyrophosphate synthase
MKSSASTSFKEQLAAYRQQLEPAIAEFCERVEREAKDEYGEYSLEAIKVFNSVLVRGGKRVRGALVLAAYEMCGGIDARKVMPVAVAMEVLQTYLLIADDIYDRSETRRGGPTAHVMVRDLHQSKHWRGDGAHFGESIASCATLIGSNLAMEEIANADLDDGAKVKMLRLVNEALRITDYGQVNDIFNEVVREVSEKQVLDTLTWKSSFYSFIGPLQLGAVAAGASDDDLTILYDYGLHLGLSFMIFDDILGTFGNQDESGKSNMDDLREGKVTALVVRALEKSTPDQRKQLLAYLGKPDLTVEEHEVCKSIITETGALDYAQKLAAERGDLALKSLDSAPAAWPADKLDFLHGLAAYMIDRKV